ncbi:MAG: lipid biosynthesis B12-binding/radical SAM protein, partial [Phycisphaerales bacterium]
MSRVFLISANTCETPYAVYPLGMATVAGALIDAGHEVRQFDWLAVGRSDSQLEQAIAAFEPEVVAVSIRNVDRVDSLADAAEAWELDAARHLVASVRRFTRAPILIGGAAVSTMPHEVRRYVGADVAVPGEGECSIVEVVAALAQGGTLASVRPVAGERLCGNCQRSPLFDSSLVSFYWDRSGIIGLQSKRGCPYRCCYCTYPELEGTRFRSRPVEAVVADVERLKRDFSVDTLFFVDSVFNDPQGQYLELAEAMASRDLGVKWACYMSPRGLTREGLELCRRAGLYAVELGTDAATDITLEAMGKPFRWSDVQETNRMCVQTGVACAHFVLFGGPQETPATVRAGLDNIAGLEHCVVFGFSGLRVYPGVPLHRRAIAEGLLQEAAPLLEP